MQKQPTKIVIIRHAESGRNIAKGNSIYFPNDAARALVQGIPDRKIQLTEEGLVQAQATSRVMKPNYGVPDVIFHSDHSRTLHTAELLLQGFKSKERSQIEVRPNLFIRERDTGYTYDMTKDEAEAAFPWLEEYWKTHGSFFSRPPGGESLADVANRVSAFLNILYSEYAGKTVFIVTHAGTIKLFRFLLEEWNYDQVEKIPSENPPKNCGVTEYRHDEEEGKLMLYSYNQTYY